MDKLKSNFGIILNPSGSLFGGAQKRFTTLFQHLQQQYPNRVHYFVSKELFAQINTIFPDFDSANVVILKNLEFSFLSFLGFQKKINSKNSDHSNELQSSKQENGQQISFIKKIIKYVKTYIKQYYLYRQIESFRKKENISVLHGVFNGILPLYFYLNKKKRKTGVIFSDMDSWFFNINDGDKNYWYLKYDSFNFGIENSDKIDFLSPFIFKGIVERRLKFKSKAISNTPCSFSDYSKCFPGDKSDFIISFAARIAPDKNPMLYLYAAKSIIKKYPYVKFNLLGEGLQYLHNEILDFININKLNENVNFCFHPNPPEIFSKSIVFVSIQTTNNYPSQSVLEAMACGNAIIASDVGDTRMFIDENVGILIPLDLDFLVGALELLINNKKLALNLGSRAREFVLKNHTIEKCAKYYIELYERTSSELGS